MEIRERSRRLFTPAVLLIFRRLRRWGSPATPPAGYRAQLPPQCEVPGRTGISQRSPLCQTERHGQRLQLLAPYAGRGTHEFPIRGRMLPTEPETSTLPINYERKVSEYAHGGKKPIEDLSDPPYLPFGCSVDPPTGNLAVANRQTKNIRRGQHLRSIARPR